MLTVNESRKITYDEANNGLEELNYLVKFDTKINQILEIKEKDLFGNYIVFNPNLVQNSEEKELSDKNDKLFLEKFKSKQVDLNVDARVKFKNKDELDIFMKNKFDKNKSENQSSNSNLLSFNPFEIKVNAATTWNKYAAKDYAAGGVTHPYSWYFDGVWYTATRSNTWALVSNNADHMYSWENTSPWYSINWSNAPYILDVGDFMYVNNAQGQTGHMMIITGAHQNSSGTWIAEYSQHTDNKRDAEFYQVYFDNANAGNVFYGLKFYSNVW